MKKFDLRLWAARLPVAVVLARNLECALVFLLDPASFAPGFELAGIPGKAAIQGFAVLFLMWNVPYLVALWNPIKHKVSLWEALAMQAVGVVGESLILVFLPAGHAVLFSSLVRFISFDAAGVILLFGATILTQNR